jgi:hypothetical protein
MDATAAVIVHEEMSSADPAFTLSYLAHSMLFVNNVNQVIQDKIEKIEMKTLFYFDLNLSPFIVIRE